MHAAELLFSAPAALIYPCKIKLETPSELLQESHVDSCLEFKLILQESKEELGEVIQVDKQECKKGRRRKNSLHSQFVLGIGLCTCVPRMRAKSRFGTDF